MQEPATPNSADAAACSARPADDGPIPQCVADLHYDLPEHLIAQQPASPRDAARLLVVDRSTAGLADRRIADLPGLLQPGDLLVANCSYVLPARFWCTRPTGGRIEGLFLRDLGHRWEVLLRGGQKLKPSERLLCVPAGEQGLIVRVRCGRGRFHVEPDPPVAPRELLERIGQVPLPPYIQRAAQARDQQSYQTVYADPAHAASVAAPTAGLHFTQELLDRLEQRGVQRRFVLLHVGMGTFAPIQTDRLDDHTMHDEAYCLPKGTLEAIIQTRTAGRRVVAVGTTTLRCLEAADGRAGEGRTRLFLRPPAQPRWADALLTNFHLPGSTLIALVMAVAGVNLTRRAYAHAVASSYRFFSYGDAMLIV